MKFWQLISIFRNEENIIKEELLKDNWKIYLSIYENYEFIVKNQKREFLDIQVDEELLRTICKKSKKIIFYATRSQELYSYENKDTDSKITLAEAVESFDHNSLEEVFEKTYSFALPKS